MSDNWEMRNRDGTRVHSVDRVMIDITNWARCGDIHPQLEFHEFTVPSGEYTYWALCPNTGQPILMEIVENEG